MRVRTFVVVTIMANLNARKRRKTANAEGDQICERSHSDGNGRVAECLRHAFRQRQLSAGGAPCRQQYENVVYAHS